GKRVPLIVAIPRRPADAPAILHRDEMAAFLRFARRDAGRAGVAKRRIGRKSQERFRHGRLDGLLRAGRLVKRASKESARLWCLLWLSRHWPVWLSPGRRRGQG